MRRSPLIPALLITLCACAAVYLPLLGATGLSQTEGHRVAPAWGMLESGDWAVPRMFGQAYLRKPPGMAWAIAGSSAVLGKNEFAARLPSAVGITLLALLNAWFAHRWFGRFGGGARRHGRAEDGSAVAPGVPPGARALRWSPALWAGLATALMPVFWQVGRSAEIEALNTLAATGAVLCILDLLLRPAPAGMAPAAAGARGRWASASSFVLPLGIGAALAGAGVLKGPAALPAAAGAALAACAVRRSLRPLARPGLWVGVALGAAAVALVYLRVRAALAASGETAVLQSPTEFFWSGDSSVLAVVRMPARAMFSALPASLALFFLFTKAADAEAAEGGTMPAGAYERARALMAATLFALGILVVLGVSNHRYAMPAVGFLPVLVGYLALGAGGAFGEGRRRLVRNLRPALWAAALLAAAGLYILKIEPRQRAGSGREAGVRLAGTIAPGAVVWADHMVEARPEVFLYAREAAREAGREFSVRWAPGLAASGRLPGAGAWLILRDDQESDEAGAFRRAGLLESLEEIERGAVHKYRFVVYRVKGGGIERQPGVGGG